MPIQRRPTSAGSRQVALRHTDQNAYRCYLPVLTGFGKDLLRRTWRSTLHTCRPHIQMVHLRRGIRPRYSGLRATGHRYLPV